MASGEWPRSEHCVKLIRGVQLFCHCFSIILNINTQMWCTSSLQTNQSISSYVEHLHLTAQERDRMRQCAPSSEWAIILLRCYLHPASVRLGLNGYKYECSWVSTACKKKKEGSTGRLTWVLPLQGKLSPFMWGAFQISDLSENKRGCRITHKKPDGDAHVPNILQVKLQHITPTLHFFQWKWKLADISKPGPVCVCTCPP